MEHMSALADLLSLLLSGRPLRSKGGGPQRQRPLAWQGNEGGDWRAGLVTPSILTGGWTGCAEHGCPEPGTLVALASGPHVPFRPWQEQTAGVYAGYTFRPSQFALFSVQRMQGKGGRGLFSFFLFGAGSAGSSVACKCSRRWLLPPIAARHCDWRAFMFTLVTPRFPGGSCLGSVIASRTCAIGLDYHVNF